MENTVNVPVLVCGESGSGKSSTFRNLDPETTLFVNTENKPMPFRTFSKFKNVNVTKYKEFSQLMRELKKDTKYKTVVIDSFTSLTEIVGRYTDTVFTGFEQWKQYNQLLQDALWDIKELPQQVFMTGIPEYAETLPGSTKGYIRVKGKELKYGGAEKEFAIVLWTKLIEGEDGEIVDYQLQYKPSKHNSAKAPHEMFEGEVPNDAKFIIEKIHEYYK